MQKVALFSGHEDDPFMNFEAIHESEEAAGPSIRKLEDMGSFCALIELSTDNTVYRT